MIMVGLHRFYCPEPHCRNTEGIRSSFSCLHLPQATTSLYYNQHHQQQEFGRQPGRVTVEAAAHTARTSLHFPAVSPSQPSVCDPALAFLFTFHQRLRSGSQRLHVSKSRPTTMNHRISEISKPELLTYRALRTQANEDKRNRPHCLRPHCLPPLSSMSHLSIESTRKSISLK